MAYDRRILDFNDDKSRFFSSVKSLKDAKTQAQGHGYDFIANNEKFIRNQYEILFDQLKKEVTDANIFWFYCYYCCIMLQNYHRIYGQDEKAKEFLKYRVEIKRICEGKPRKEKQFDNSSFSQSLKKKISTSLAELSKTPQQTSKIISWVTFANVERIYWFFCRTTLTKSFLLARDLQWIDRIASGLGKPIDVDNIISVLEKPTSVLRVLSVGLFAFRFIINAALLVKHTYGSQGPEGTLEGTLAWQQRFYNEIYKRHPIMLNDLAWSTANLITNYNSLFGIPDPTAGWIVAGFLFFDFCVLVWRHHLAKKEYELKRAQLDSELRGVGEGDRSRLEEMIKSLDIKWQAESGTLWFNATAALLLTVGFSASMIFTAPGLILASYVLCTFAFTMYTSDKKYQRYKEKSLLFEQAKRKCENYEEQKGSCAKEEKKYYDARDEFILTMAKNMLMPTVFIVTYAIFWEAALLLTAAYVGYQLYDAYTKHAENSAKPKKVEITEEEMKKEDPQFFPPDPTDIAVRIM